jgi:acyl-CoA dehydrogenase
VLAAADRSFLAWPFFGPEHRAWARDLAVWADRELPALVDHEAVDDSCRRLVRALGQGGWLRAAVPTSAATTYSVRALCLARETLAYHDGLADFAYAMQGLGSGPIVLF